MFNWIDDDPFIQINKTVIDGLASIWWRQPAKSSEETLARRRNETFVQILKTATTNPSIQISNKLSKCHTQAVSAEAEDSVWYKNSQPQEEKALKDGENLEIMFNQAQQLGSNRTTSIQYGSGTYWLVFYFLYSSISSWNLNSVTTAWIYSVERSNSSVWI